MHSTPTPLSGVFLIERVFHGDARGFLSRLYCAESLASVGWNKPVAQINHTLTAVAGTVRGMHFQLSPHSEMKLVSCIRGEVWDVAVDLRCDSPTFLRWHAERLSSENHRALLIPEGCAHGFQALQDGCELIYCHSAPYAASAEGGVRYDDPAVAIQWPLPACNLSSRDLSHPLLSPAFRGLVLS